MKIPAFAALAVLLPLAAHAADLKPAQGYRHNFRNGAAVTVFYTPEPDGYHVVATIQSDDSEHQAVSRVISILAPGQSTTVSVPTAPGTPEDVVAIARVGDTITVGAPPMRTARK
jgi:hypothetical protein